MTADAPVDAAEIDTTTSARGSFGLVVVAVTAALAGIAATAADAAPTGRTATDTVLVAVGVGLITMIGSRAPWWALALAGCLSAIALDTRLVVLAGVAVAIPTVARLRRVDQPALSAISVAITFNVLIRAGHEQFLGLTAIVGALCAAIVFVTGIRRFSRPVRRAAWLGTTAVALVVIAAAAGIGVAVSSARHALSDGVRSAELGVAALEHDEFEEAAEWFRRSAEQLAYANDQLDRPWAEPAAFVPILAQHHDAVVDMSAVGAEGAATVAAALDEIDLDSLRVEDGQIDLDALAALEAPLQEVRRSLGDLQAAAADARSPWLIPRATEALDDFDSSVADHLPSLDTALEAVGMAPDLLGDDAPRRYLLLFTTPSESRGLGGFIGSYAELTAVDGALILTNAGQTSSLDLAAAAAGARVEGQPEFVARYGQFGYDGEGGAVGDAAFRNLAMTPHFPWVGEIAADVYEQTTGRPIDGVIVVDPFVIAELLEYTGPIELSSFGYRLTADNAAGFLLHDQYVVGADDNPQRHDVLAEAATATFNVMMTGALPDPIQLAADMGPLVEERRLLVWSAHAEEQALLHDLGIDGAIPALDGGDGWAFTVSNAVPNKIDSYLERRASYVSTDVAGTTTATLRIELTNTAPAAGLPSYIIGGGPLGLPDGTSRLYLSVYSALGLDSMTVDGERVGVEAGVEQGWNVYSHFIEIPAGHTVTIEVELARVIDDPQTVVTWVQPMSRPLEIVE